MNTIINSAINQLQKEGLNIKTNFADSYVKKTPYNEMNNYYNGIDILL